jgi:hypothetical protein
MPMDSISMCSITLYYSNMNVGNNHIILTPEVKVSPAHLVLIVSLVKCLQSMSEVCAVCRLDMYHTNVLMYHTMVVMAHLTKGPMLDV